MNESYFSTTLGMRFISTAMQLRNCGLRMLYEPGTGLESYHYIDLDVWVGRRTNPRNRSIVEHDGAGAIIVEAQWISHFSVRKRIIAGVLL
jgi:hypothetical protein